MMSEDAGCAERFLSALLAAVAKPISDLRLLISGLCPLLFALCLVVAILLALCLSVDAQQSKKVPRVGFLSGAGAPSHRPSVEAFRQGLHDLGYVEGKNIVVEYRYPEGGPERIRKFLTELMQLKVDILVVAAGVRSPAGDQDNSHCHGDYWRSSSGWASR
jgi:hypothetical protein